MLISSQRYQRANNSVNLRAVGLLVEIISMDTSIILIN